MITPTDLPARLLATAVNGAEYLRYGGLRTEADPAPFDVVTTQPVYRLRHYFPAAPADRPAVLLVPPLMQVAEVWDISPATSAVRMLHQHGVDPWVVDFGDPAREPGGADRDVTDHVVAVSDAVARIHHDTGRDVHILGYSQGGLFAYQAAAYRRCRAVGSVITLGSPIGFHSTEKFLPERVLWQIADLQRPLLQRTGVPRTFVAQAFKWAQPQQQIMSKIEYVKALHDRDALLPREPQRKFLEDGAWVSWSGPAAVELFDFARHQRFVNGGLVFGDRTVGFADLTCPVLLVIGTSDVYGPIDYCRQIVHAAPNADVREIVLPTGHFGLPVSSHARRKTWPGVAAWTRWVENGDDLPDYVQPVDRSAVPSTAKQSPSRGLLGNLSYAVGLTIGTGLSAPATATRAAGRAAATARDLSVEAVRQLPQLLRLETMRPGTRISFAKLIADRTAAHPDDICFVYRGRAHTRAAADTRTDNVIRGLLSLGTRKGQRIGVLMDPRPSALMTVTALNRIGAVAVLLRPGPDLPREARLAAVTSVVADPENAEQAVALGLPVWSLGGGADRELPAGVTDMEQIDPATVTLPAWYRPNPGRARDLAFILFTGQGADTHADPISNGRWATSALAAASAARLTPADTVYSVSPLHHRSGLLLTTAAAVAGGARLAMAQRFDPDTFWTEVRRYGATVVPYTWTMLHALVAAEPRPEEQHHPIRLFIGSGMPTNLWTRVSDRFAPAAVLELYASTRTDAIIGNVSGRKLGAMGRPLPGTPQVRVAGYDAAAGRLLTGSDGFVVPAAADEVGMLLVAADPSRPQPEATVLRGVFRTDDAWIVTGDLFREDGAGDLWFIDQAGALIPTPHGTVVPRTVEQALGTLDAIDLAVCYPVEQDGTTRAVAAITCRPGRSLTAGDITDALAGLPTTAGRPATVHLLDGIPVNAWYRPDITALQTQEVSRGDHVAWTLNVRTGAYRSLPSARRQVSQPA
jgi:putative long chain acyl-CoA synthase